MANVWLHNGFLQVEGEKMSKSLGNFITIRDVLNDWPGEVVRLTMLKTHYRQPIDWTLRGPGGIAAASSSAGTTPPATRPRPPTFPARWSTRCATTSTRRRRSTSFIGSRVRPEARPARCGPARTCSASSPAPAATASSEQVDASGVDVAAVEALIAERRAARAAKDWAASDRARDALAALGVAVKDNKDGTTTWTVAG